MTQVLIDALTSLAPPATTSTASATEGDFANQLASVAAEPREPARSTSERSSETTETAPQEQANQTAEASDQQDSGQETADGANDADTNDQTPEVAATETIQPTEDLVELSEEADAEANDQGDSAAEAEMPEAEKPEPESDSDNSANAATKEPTADKTTELTSQEEIAPTTSNADQDNREEPASNSAAEENRHPDQMASVKEEGAADEAKPAAEGIAAQASHVAGPEPTGAPQGATEDPTATTASVERVEPRQGETGGRSAGDQSTGKRDPREQTASANQPQATKPTAEDGVLPDPSEEATPRETITPKEPTVTSATQDADRPDSPSSSLERIATGRLAAARTTETAPASPTERVDPARFVSRVSRAFNAAGQRGGEVRLRLSPPELGAMQIKLSTSSEGALTASVETETTAARNLLLDNLPALRERLAAMDIRVEKFDVDVQQQGHGQQDWTADEKDDQQNREQTPEQETRSRDSASPVTPESSSPNPAMIGPDQINLVA